MARRHEYIRKTTDLGGGRKLITYEPNDGGLFGPLLGFVFIGIPALLINFAWFLIISLLRVLLWIFKTLSNLAIFTVNRVSERWEQHWWLGLLTL